MSPLVVEVLNQTRFTIDDAVVTRLASHVLRAEGVTHGELGVRFVGERRMRRFNRDHRGEDRVTDVLAFPLERVLLRDGAPVGREPGPDPDGAPRLLGDVVVCLAQAARQAKRAQSTLTLEVALLVVHGTLHIVGYDHEVDSGRMALRQAELLEEVSAEGIVAQG